MFHGKKAVSVWRVTFVRKGFDPTLNYCIKLPDGRLISDSSYKANMFLTYFCFGTCLPDALKKLWKFVPRSQWTVYHFERFTELDYNLIYEL